MEALQGGMVEIAVLFNNPVDIVLAIPP